MTEKFVASNGVEIGVGEEGHIIIPPIRAGLGELTRQALREFFLHEQGIWVDKPTGALVLLNGGAGEPRYVSIFVNGLMYGVSEADGPGTGKHREVAGRYFAAHPKPKPKPWHDAKPGEVWEVENVTGSPRNAWALDSGAFMYEDESWVTRDSIVSARRIWPVSDV